MRQVGSVLWPKLRALQIYGANTGVGKTVFSSALARAFRWRLPHVHYLKPVSTGPLDEADDRHISALGGGVHSQCLFQFDKPVSPHIAARSSPITDEKLISATYDEIKKYAKGDQNAIVLLETAGGVLSPSPSGSSQADLYRPLRLPVLLIGDHKLGGIGTTISAWESLHLRGYDVQSIALFEEDRYDNYNYLRGYFGDRGISSWSVPPPPERHTSADQDARQMQEYYERISQEQSISNFVDSFVSAHDERVDRLQSMPAAAHEVIWHPFMQHTERSADTIVAMDSAYGDDFQTWSTKRSQSPQQVEENMLKPAFDASASWWTQGLGHGNPRLALTAAHAAGRYGHVMFAGAVHEPALTLAQTLVRDMGNSRLAKVFYTDNGSTGMEVAVKMALRATSLRNGWQSEDDVQILGLKGSYHGDTMGTMDCSEPSLFNKKVEWYRGRGHWFDFPEVKMRDGEWQVEIPEQVAGQGENRVRSFDTLDAIFDLESTARSEDRALYMRYIHEELSRLRQAGTRLGALIMEPVILGAGGMLFADPLFQRCCVDYVRQQEAHEATGKDWQGMPVIFDEVFTGLYRLGQFSAASFLGVEPDIVVNAKLLTGGLLPLCTTTASNSIYEAFLSDSKSDALLHGHSYTAHAVGCAVANESLKTMQELEYSPNWDHYRADWIPKTKAASTSSETVSKTWSMWSQSFVTSMSRKPNVDYVFALGSVMAISVKDPAGSGYSSTAAAGLRDKLFAGVDDSGSVVHSRVLGNVLYLMAAMTTTPETLEAVELQVMAAV